ncbi:pilus assembly protein [uncultured Jannaschia sp.]|uniref:pilus assembly protein n=1 Tax=uncultured Jannaschia sp. TaxID=293347 RepID=UPI002629E896|nr:pilus assembly protein [uncultured Jannaschia sp.]
MTCNAIPSSLSTFARAEEGAVTVDWVVLTAALVGLGLAVLGVVSSGVQDISSDLDTQLQATSVEPAF